METTLLRSCLALPKVAFSLRTCPPSHIIQATATFDDAMREALTDLTGCPLSGWAWLKASLPSSRGGLNIRRATLHSSAAYIGSLVQTRTLVSKILGRIPAPSPHLDSAVSALANATKRPDWSSLQRLTFLADNILSPAVLMMQLTNNCSTLPQTLDPRLWPSLRPSHKQVPG